MHAACQVRSHILLSLCTEWLSLNSWYVFSVNHHIHIGTAVHTLQSNGTRVCTTSIYCQDLEMHGIYPPLTSYGVACMHTKSVAIYV